MKIPNASRTCGMERTGSENLGARLWRLPPRSANTLHKHIRAEKFYFVLEGTGRLRVGDETLTVPKIRRRAGRAGPAAPGVQRHRRRGALVDRGRAGGIGISSRLKIPDGPLAHLPGRPDSIAKGIVGRGGAAE